MKIRLKILPSIIFIILFFGLLLENNRAENSYPQYGSVYYIAIPYFPLNLEPILSASPVDQLILSNIYEGLIELNEFNQPVGRLALSWDLDTTGLIWTFHLRNNVYFHNNEPMDALAVKASFERLLSPEYRSPKSWILDSIIGGREYITGQADEIIGIKVIDSLTVQFQFRTPVPDFLYYLSTQACSIVSLSTTGSINQKPFGTGPFLLEQLSGQKQITLAQNPFYYAGRPYLDKIRFIVIPQDNTKILEFELANLHDTAIPESVFRRFSADERWADYINRLSRVAFNFIVPNLTRRPMNDIRFRQALSFAIDRNSLINVVLNNHGRIPMDFIELIPNSIDTIESVNFNRFIYSIDSARLLAQPFSRQSVQLLIPSGSEIIRNIAQRIQLNARQAGLLIYISEAPYPIFHQSILMGDFDLYYASYYPELNKPEWILRELFLERNRGPMGNTSYFYNSDFISLLDKYRTELDTELRSSILQQCNNILSRNMPIIPLYYLDLYFLHQSIVRGLDFDGLYHRDMSSVWLDEKWE